MKVNVNIRRNSLYTRKMAGLNENLFIPTNETILQQTYLEALQSNLASVQRWTSWKEDHERLKKTLSDLPNKLTHPVVIPFGSRALVKADIVNTNEILSCLGDGWFVKQSAKQAVDLCDRRIKESQHMLDSLEKERDLINNRQTLPKAKDAFASEDQQDIVEEYDEAEEAEWRVRHREKERKYRQELAELRKKREEEGPPQTEEDLFRRLDMLELEEELNDELERLNCESDSDEEREEEDTDQCEDNESEEEREKQDGQEKESSYNLKNNSQMMNTDNQTCDNKIPSGAGTSLGGYQKVSKNTPALAPGQVSYGFTDTQGNDWERAVLTNASEDGNVRRASLKSTKRVSFACDNNDSDTNDEELSPHIFIRFKHSDNECTNPCNDHSSGSGDNAEITSPKDIYTRYAHFMSTTVPKPALKKTSSYGDDYPSTARNPAPLSQPFGSSFGLSFEDDSSDSDNDEIRSPPQPSRDLSHLPPVLGDVSEIVVNLASESSEAQSRPTESYDTSTKRPMSKFKSMRSAPRK